MKKKKPNEYNEELINKKIKNEELRNEIEFNTKKLYDEKEKKKEKQEEVKNEKRERKEMEKHDGKKSIDKKQINKPNILNLEKIITVKCTLNQIILKDDYKKILFDACFRTNKIVIHTYQFLKLWILDHYHKNIDIPLITFDKLN